MKRIHTSVFDIEVTQMKGRTWVLLCAPEWATVVAVTREGKLLLVRPFRHGIGRPSWEIPAGLVEKREALLAAAKRELVEEAGHRSGKWKKLGWVHPNPAFMDNRCHLFLARDCMPVAGVVPDPYEEILETVALPVSRVRKMMRQGKITNAMTLLALQRYFCGS